MALMDAGFDSFFKKIEDCLYSAYSFTKLEKTNYDASLDTLYIRCRFYLYGEEKFVLYAADGFMIRDAGYSVIADDAIKVICGCINRELINGRRKNNGVDGTV